jgi:hypothetical protein
MQLLARSRSAKEPLLGFLDEGRREMVTLSVVSVLLSAASVGLAVWDRWRRR